MRAMYFGDGGTTRTLRAAYYGDGGTNRLVFAPIQLSNQSISSTATLSATAGYRLTSAGAAQKRE